MKSLYLRVWLTLVALLALFALGSGVLFQRQVERERGRVEVVTSDRMSAWADLIQRSLPSADAPPQEQAAALREWSQRLGLPMALDDAAGDRIAASASFERRMALRDGARDGRQDSLRDGGSDGAREGLRMPPRAIPVKLADGRTLWVMRVPRLDPSMARSGPPGAGSPQEPGARAPGRPFGPAGAATPARWWPWPQGVGIAALLGLLFVGVAVGAYPVVRRLTRRLESLKQGVEQFGAGALSSRVDDAGKDEVAAVARSFNQAAARIESLVQSNRSLLANASHELRSPLARMKMAVSMLGDDLPPAQHHKLLKEIHTNIGELDVLVDEVLLASRLDAQQSLERRDPVDLHPMVLEEAARVNASVVLSGNLPSTQPPGDKVVVLGDERLLRRAARNLLENARRYGGGGVDVQLLTLDRHVELRVADRGPGVPDDMRERIFEPFFRMPGHAEREGGVGLGLSLVKQIAHRHGGSAHCEPRDGAGSVFVLRLPRA